MDIASLRDIAIFILAFEATIVVLLIVILAVTVMLYRKLSPILDSAKATTKTVENISSCVAEEVIRPLAQAASLIQGIRQAASLFNRFSRKEKG